MDNQRLQQSTVALTGVAETLLWPLWMRTTEARKNDGFFEDPLGIALIDGITYDFAKFGKPNGWHAVRAKFSDDLIRRFLAENPRGPVIALGDGLETQFWRVDNGAVQWISVDLPEAIDVRRQFLPAHPRVQSIACSALEPDWMDAISATEPVFVTAGGLLMYFSEQQAEHMLRDISARLPRAELFCDLIPRWLSRKTLRGLYTTKRYRAPPMPFGLNPPEVAGFLHDCGFDVVRSLTYPEAFPKWSPLGAAAMRIPWLRDHAPSLVHARSAPQPRAGSGAATAPAAH